MIKTITGGICASKGFRASGIHCGMRRKPGKKDLALIVSEVPATTAAVFTTNLVKGAPIKVNKEHLKDGIAQAIIINSGIANTCNANGVELAESMAKLAADYTGVKQDDVLVASTGVIGAELRMDPIINGMPFLLSQLSDEGSIDACRAIMTTDTRVKEIAVEFEIQGVPCHLGAIGKGSGMIHPNLATMLVFSTSDVAISHEMLQKALSGDVTTTFNMMSVDGDTSTNDMCVVMANGLAKNPIIDKEGEDFDIFMKALNTVNVYMARSIAGDGEGCTKLLECVVTGADTEEDAKKVAKSVICSSLTKAAMFGEDANWGRILCAAGYSGANIDVEKIDLDFKSSAGQVALCRDGNGIPFSEELASRVLHEREIDILLNLGDGPFKATAWGCDLTYEYVKINGEYRS